MKKFRFQCDFGGHEAGYSFFIGAPKDENHPIQYQADWLSKERGGIVPQEVMDAISQLHELSKRNKVPLEDLCVYALGAARREAQKDEDNGEEEDAAEVDKD